MAYQVPRYKQQSTITKMLHGMFTQGLPAYAAYKTEQKAEKEKKKEADRKIKEAETKNKLDFYTAMTKDKDPMIRGTAVGKLEELLGTTPYSAVMGQEKLRPRGLPQRGMLQPGRMQMGPQAGGVMTTRQPSMGEIIKGGEPAREVETVKPKTPTWGQQQNVSAIKEGARRGRIVLGKQWGEPTVYEVKSQQDLLDAIGEAGLGQELFKEEIAMWKAIIVYDEKGKPFEIANWELPQALKQGYSQNRIEEPVPEKSRVAPRQPTTGRTGITNWYERHGTH